MAETRFIQDTPKQPIINEDNVVCKMVLVGHPSTLSSTMDELIGGLDNDDKVRQLRTIRPQGL